MYYLAKKTFINENFVSTASLQRKLKISYRLARFILDKMIESEFCQKQFGAWPCKVNRFVN